MRFCLMIEGQEGVTWGDWLALAQTAERLGFEALFRSDHCISGQGRLRLGTLVSQITFRSPSVLARSAATVDQISGGRVEIGMGAGWWGEEHTQFGFPFPSTVDRFAMLEEQLEIVDGLLAQQPFSFHGEHYALDRAELLPSTVQRPRPPIILGGRRVGPWMQRLVGRWADEFNTVGGTTDEVRKRFERARSGIEAVGREQRTLVTSLMTWCFVGETHEDYLTRLRRAHAADPVAGPFDAYRADVEADCIVGTPERAADRLAEYSAAGVQRILLNHGLFDDHQMLEFFATQVFPKVEG